MKNIGIKLAIFGFFVGMFMFIGMFPLGEAAPYILKYWFAGFVLFYLGLPIGGLIYDIKSGDFEERNGYKP